MVTYRTYNFDFHQLKTWQLTDKRKSVEIHDTKNKLCFYIEFGKAPKISVYDLKDEEIGKMKFEIEVENELKILNSKMDININK